MTPPTTKTLDSKIRRILDDPSCSDFILADAKDADMAFGMASPGRSPEHHAEEGRFRTLHDYREMIRQNVHQGLLDIMLMSASTNDQMTIAERLFDGSTVTPAARANDTTDIHQITGGVYGARPSRPFRTATIDHIMCGKVECAPGERHVGADLGLYSVTFNNDLERDLETLNAYRDFRLEAEGKGFRHFLEVFNPNACGDHCPEDLGRFINDHIARLLAGVTGRGRPLFLKIAYHGPAAMEQLASYDRTLVPGILGGASGTTYDSFYQLWEARKYGARAALYGRMINNSEHQLTFIQHLRWLSDGDLDDPAEAVRSYHGGLEKLNIRPYRRLEDDLLPTHRESAYRAGKARPSGGAGTGKAGTASSGDIGSSVARPVSRQASSELDFASMSVSEKVAWNQDRWDRVFG